MTKNQETDMREPARPMSVIEKRSRDYLSAQREPQPRMRPCSRFINPQEFATVIEEWDELRRMSMCSTRINGHE